MSSNHLCRGETASRMYGGAIGRCHEDADGTLWVDNDEYMSQVNYCPYCGYKARTLAEVVVDRFAKGEAQRELDAEEIAHEFHATYERLAPHFGDKTREASAVDWKDMPEQNRNLMISVVNDLLRRTVILPRWMGDPNATDFMP